MDGWEGIRTVSREKPRKQGESPWFCKAEAAGPSLPIEQVVAGEPVVWFVVWSSRVKSLWSGHVLWYVNTAEAARWSKLFLVVW